MAPRRNPDIVVAVLWEHGYWGNNSAKLAAQVVEAYVSKQRAKAGNLVKLAAAPKPGATDGQATPVAQRPKQEETPAAAVKTTAVPAGQ